MTVDPKNKAIIYQKLVRDRIPEIIRNQGKAPYIWKIALPASLGFMERTISGNIEMVSGFLMCSKLKSDYPIPFPRSYWVIPSVFLAGEFPGAKDAGEARQKLERLYDAGIRHVINLMEPDEIDHDGNPFDSYKHELTEIAGKQDGSISFDRYPIKDLHIPDADQMTAILDAIDAAIDAHQPVYVHCWGGIGRTGTVVGCFLIRHGLATSRNVLDVIHGLRKNDPKIYRTSPETSAQVKFVALMAQT